MFGKLMMGAAGACLAAGAVMLAPPEAQSATVAVAQSAAVPMAAVATPALTTVVPALVAVAAPATDEASRVRAVAERELDRLGQAIPKHDRVAIVDYSRPSAEPRLFLVDMASGEVTAYRVTHGKGSDPTHTGRLVGFSGVDGSEATSRGAYRSAELYTGQHGRSMRLDGLDADNRSARQRAIVVHAAAYAEPSMVRARGMLGRSQGCFAVSSGDLAPVLDFLGQGRLLFADRL